MTHELVHELVVALITAWIADVIFDLSTRLARGFVSWSARRIYADNPERAAERVKEWVSVIENAPKYLRLGQAALFAGVAIVKITGRRWRVVLHASLGDTVLARVIETARAVVGLLSAVMLVDVSRVLYGGVGLAIAAVFLVASMGLLARFMRAQQGNDWKGILRARSVEAVEALMNGPRLRRTNEVQRAEASSSQGGLRPRRSMLSRASAVLWGRLRN